METEPSTTELLADTHHQLGVEELLHDNPLSPNQSQPRQHSRPSQEAALDGGEPRIAHMRIDSEEMVNLDVGKAPVPVDHASPVVDPVEPAAEPAPELPPKTLLGSLANIASLADIGSLADIASLVTTAPPVASTSSAVFGGVADGPAPDAQLLAQEPGRRPEVEQGSASTEFTQPPAAYPPFPPPPGPPAALSIQPAIQPAIPTVLTPSSSATPHSTHVPTPSSNTTGTSSPGLSIVSLENATTSGQRKPPVVFDPLASSTNSPRITKPVTSPLLQPFTNSTLRSIADPRYNILPTRYFIDPNIFYDIPAIDPISDAIAKNMTPVEATRIQRRCLKASDVINEPNPFAALIRANSWRAVAQLARQRLVQTHPLHVDDVMALWFARLVALTKLSLFELASAELDKLGDLNSPSLQFEKYPEFFPGRLGPMVHFDILVLQARLSALKGNHSEALAKYYQLICRLRRQSVPESSEAPSGQDPSAARVVALAREGRLHLLITNSLLALKDYTLAVANLKSILSVHNTAELKSALGRIYLLYGNVPLARATFEQVDQDIAAVASDTGATQEPGSVDLAAVRLMNWGLCQMAQSQIQDAIATFTSLITLDPTNATAVNNLAICQLYGGNVGQAVSFLESCAVAMPQKAGICEPLVFNLATLYDLMDLSLDRKKKLLAQVVAKHGGDNFKIDQIKL
ncbi:uncharacterized protein BJ171DRAFT_517865 [Polychytrium aggregatum]|uniref:uncharacterized protein n=1 Tax=Polychytrium aggregatum TaxID=110093 RepID=UPI0022FEA55D|nr:uncharacterized protein BJ171DRAFT_517865 [Polychytrium aggregatum]KAI9199536.1 hypothetical protein BJ171DRAFT_517865 [Polychytrium aggregatum]